MSDPGLRGRLKRPGSWPFLGLLLVLAFLSHDALMAAPAQASAAERLSLALSLDVLALDASSPHGCTIGRTAALGTQNVLFGHSTSSGVTEHFILSRPTGLPLYAGMTQARSPTAQRAVLQVFRI